MKIAFFVGVFFPQPGGVQIQTNNIANTMVKMGHEVDIFLLNKTNIKKNSYGIIIINKIIISIFYYLNYFLNINLSFLFRLYLKFFLKVDKYDFFHFHYLNHKMLYLINNLKFLKKKIIVTFHGADIEFDPKINYGYRLDKIYEKIFIKTIPKIDFFFTISKSIKQDILNLGIDEKKIYLLPNTICLEKIKKFKNFKKKIKDKIYILTVTRYSKTTKGLDLIPKIAQILKKNNIKYEWSLVGKDINKIRQFAGMDEHINNFKFFGNIINFNESIFPNSKLIKIYKKHHIYVSLSRIEAFPMTLMEALACELPVLSFNTRGGSEIVVNNFNGILVKEYSEIKMANNIVSYQKKNVHKIHRKNTLKSVLKYDLTNISKKIIRIYKEII